MKRIRKVIASALTLVMSILVMCVGVYAATSAPKVSISGSISYDVGACKVRVIGNLNGAYTDANGSGTTPVSKTATDNKGQACHYYGVHDNAQSETNMLPEWDIGSVYFKETAGGAESFVITLRVENLSAYPIKATVNNTATEALTNVTKKMINNEAIIGVGGSSEIQVRYDVIDSSKLATLIVGSELVFEKTVLTPSAQENWTYRLEDDNKVSLLKYTGSETNIVIPSTFEIEGTEYPVYSVGDSEAIITELDPAQVAPYIVFSNLASPNTSIQSIVVSEGIESIGVGSLGMLMGIQKVTLPSSLTSVKMGAFAYSVVSEIYIPESVQELGALAFMDCSNLSHIDLPSNLKTIGMWAFMNCSNLVQANIPKSVINYGQGMFANCTALVDVVIEEGVTLIIDECFAGCSSLKTLELPKTISEIQYQSLLNVENLVINATTPPNLNEGALSENVKIYVPKSSIELYKSAEGWKLFDLYSI